MEAVGGGGLLRRDGAPVGEGERGRAGELRWRLGKLVGCPVRAHGDRRRELRGGLGGGGANGGRRQLWTPCGARSSARSREERRVRTLWSSREGSRRVKGEGRAGAVGRVVTMSPWWFGGHPRLACRDRRRVVGSRSFREEPWRSGLGARRGRGSWPAASARHGAKQGREREQRE